MFLARNLGASPEKDILDTAIIIPTALLTSTGVNAWVKSSLFISARIPDEEGPRLSSYFKVMLLITGLVSVLFFIILILLKQPILTYFGKNLEGSSQFYSSCYDILIGLVLFQPIYQLYGNLLTGKKKYGTLPLTITIQKTFSLIGVALIPVVGLLIYPQMMLIGAIISCIVILVYGQIKIKHLFSHVFLSLTDAYKTFKLTWPWIISSPLLNASKWIITPMIIALGPGVLASYGYALVINSMFVAIFLTPLLDSFSPLLAESEQSDITRTKEYTINIGIRLSILIGTILSTFSIACAKPIVSLLYYRGEMEFSSVVQIAQYCMILGLIPLARAIVLFAVRFFQAKLSPISQIRVQILDPIVSIGFTVLTIEYFGIWAVLIGRVLGIFVCSLYSFSSILRNVRQLNVDFKFLAFILMSIAASIAIAYFITVVHKGILFNLLQLSGVALFLLAMFTQVMKFLKFDEYQMLIRVLRKNWNKLNGYIFKSN